MVQNITVQYSICTQQCTLTLYISYIFTKFAGFLPFLAICYVCCLIATLFTHTILIPI